MSNKMLFPQVIETIEESFAGTECAYVHISTPGLLKNPVQQTERMKPSTEIGLGGLFIQRLKNRPYVPPPAHLNQFFRE